MILEGKSNLVVFNVCEFLTKIADNLNAEVSSGSVSSIDDAVLWLSYSYLDVRLQRNPFHYGVNRKQISDLGGVNQVKVKFVTDAARELDKARVPTVAL